MRRWLTALFGLALVVVWLASPELPSPARLLVVFLVTLLPALLLAQGVLLREAGLGEIPRGSVYLSSSLALWLLAAVTLAVALTSGFTPEQLGLRPLPAARLLGWSAAATLGGIGILALGRLLRVGETPLLEHLLPRTRREKLAFFGVAITAGVCEELVFRGFLIPALSVVLGSVWSAALLSSVVFGFLHGYQGPVGVVRTALLGLLLAVPLLMTGSVLPSMLAHLALDVIAGLWLADWLLWRDPPAT